MRILFTTQSESLRLFDALLKTLDGGKKVESAGFIVADSMSYLRWIEANPDFENRDHLVLKEWEITAAPYSKPDLNKLARYEREIGGNAGLFGALIADRRLFMGPDCTYTQDYRRRFSDDELLCILQRGLEHVELLFETLKPDVVINFICVTMLDYLAYLFAKARGIRFLNLRPTRVGDRVSFSQILNDPSPELATSYNDILNGRQSAFQLEAENYVRRVREQHGRYEGVIKPSDKPALQSNPLKYTRVKAILTAFEKYLSYKRSVAKSDNHVPNPIRTFLYSGVINPRIAKQVGALFAGRYIKEKDLGVTKYAFFPLHTEPEVSLLVYGRPYVNQIEVIRMVAMSLPVDTVLVVKEHPWMIGKRSISSYKKMLNIPRVIFADPKLEARTLVKNAELICVITGSVALEAAMLGKPVITFGDCPYNLLPDTMVNRCDDPRNLPSIIREMIGNYKNDTEAMEAYIAGVFETSISLNLYSVLLSKANVHSERKSSYHEEIEKLATYTLSSLDAEKLDHPQNAAPW